jgi:hypothetical protein
MRQSPCGFDFATSRNLKWDTSGGNTAVLRSRGDWELAADHAGIERAPVFPESFDVEVKRLLCVGSCLVERVQAREVGRIDVVAAVLLRSEDKLDLAWLIHKVQDSPGVMAGQPPSLGT